MTITGKRIRQTSTPHGTPGHQKLDNGFECDTLELPWASNKRGVSCTAPGVDKGRVWFSPHLQCSVIKFEDRNGRQEVEQHKGNWAGEAPGETTQVHGCTLVGQGFGDIQRPPKLGGGMQFGILSSGDTLTKLIASLRDSAVETPSVGPDGYITGYHDVEISCEWAPGCEPTEDVV